MSTIILAVVFVALLFIFPFATILGALGYWIGGRIGAVIGAVVWLLLGG